MTNKNTAKYPEPEDIVFKWAAVVFGALVIALVLVLGFFRERNDDKTESRNTASRNSSSRGPVR